VQPPVAIKTFRPHIPDKEDEPVRQAELYRNRQIGLKLLASAFRNEAQPAREIPGAQFPRHRPEQALADTAHAAIRFASARQMDHPAGISMREELLCGRNHREAPALVGERFPDGLVAFDDDFHIDQSMTVRQPRPSNSRWLTMA